MRTLIAILFACTTMSFSNDPFNDIMNETIKELYGASNTEDYQLVINKLDRIKQVNPDRWEVDYYSSLALIFRGNLLETATEKDTHFDKAIQNIKSRAASEQNPKVISEFVALQGFAMMIKLNVNPMERGPVYTPTIFGLYEKAMALDSSNPRAV